MNLTSRFWALIFLACMPTFPAKAQALPESLFFTQDEIGRIEKLVAQKTPAEAAPEQATVTLGAIVYASPREWTVWLQGEPWTPQTKKPYLRIKSVTHDKVQLIIAPWGSGTTRDVTLRPFETYDPVKSEISATQQKTNTNQ